MKKAVVALTAVAGLGICAFGAAAYAGNAVTGRVEEQAHELTRMLPTAKIVSEQKSSGLFRSSYDATVQFGCWPASLPGDMAGATTGKQEPLQLVLRNQVQHGPLPGGRGVGLAVIETELRLPAALEARAKAVLGDQPLLHARTKVGMNGSYESEFSLPGIQVAQGTGQLSLKPVHGSASGNTGDRTSSYEYQIPTVELSAGQGSDRFAFTVSNLVGRGSFQRSPGSAVWLVPSDSTGSIDRVHVTGHVAAASSQDIAMELSELRFNGKTQLDKAGLFSSTSGGSFRAKVKDYVIDRVDTQVTLRRLHAASYQKMLEQLLLTFLSCDAPPPSDPGALLGTLKPLALELLKHDPEYSLDKLGITLDGKSAELSYSAGVKGVTADDLNTEHPEALSKKATLRGSLKVHLGLIERAISEFTKAMQADPNDPQAAAAAAGAPPMAMVYLMVDQAVQAGYVVREGDFVKASASYEAGELLLNGKPLALPDFGVGAGSALLPSGP